RGQGRGEGAADPQGLRPRRHDQHGRSGAHGDREGAGGARVSILIDKNTRLIVQGITGRDGAFHTKQMLDYGTKVVGGVTPGKGGSEMHGGPVFESVAEAVAATPASTTAIYL